MSLVFFFFNDTATTEIYTLSLHDALPILGPRCWRMALHKSNIVCAIACFARSVSFAHSHIKASLALPCSRSEEHTSELQSQSNLVCRLLLEKKKIINHSLSHAGSRLQRSA